MQRFLYTLYPDSPNFNISPRLLYLSLHIHTPVVTYKLFFSEMFESHRHNTSLPLNSMCFLRTKIFFIHW